MVGGSGLGWLRSGALPGAVGGSLAGRACDEGADMVGNCARDRVVDDHAEVGSAIDREGGVFQLDRAQDRMSEAFDPFP